MTSATEFCTAILDSTVPDAVKQGAQAILDHRTLARASQRAFADERKTLLRGVTGSPSTGGADVLLRAADALETDDAELERNATLLERLKRLFRRNAVT